MILVNSGAFLSISSWFCELTELIFVMIPYISSTGYTPQNAKDYGYAQVANNPSVPFYERRLSFRALRTVGKCTSRYGGLGRAEPNLPVHGLLLVWVSWLIQLFSCKHGS